MHLCSTGALQTTLCHLASAAFLCGACRGNLNLSPYYKCICPRPIDWTRQCHFYARHFASTLATVTAVIYTSPLLLPRGFLRYFA